MKLKIHDKKLLSMLVAGSIVLTGCSFDSSIDEKNFKDIISDVESDYVVDDYLSNSEVEFAGEKVDLIEAGIRLEDLIDKFSKIRNMEDICIFTPNNDYYDYYKENMDKFSDEYIDELIRDFNSENNSKKSRAFNYLSSYKTYLNKQFKKYGLSSAYLLLEDSIKGVSIDALSNYYMEYRTNLDDYDTLELLGSIDFNDNSNITIEYNNNNYDFYDGDAYSCLTKLDKLMDISEESSYFTTDKEYYDDGNIYYDTCLEALNYSKEIIFREGEVSNNKIRNLK